MRNKKALSNVTFWIIILCLAFALGTGTYLWKSSHVKEIEDPLGHLDTAGEIDVPPGTTGLKVLLSWEGGGVLELILIKPDGSIAKPGTGGIFYFPDTETERERYEIYNPMPGKWVIKMFPLHGTGQTYNVNIYQTSQEL